MWLDEFGDELLECDSNPNKICQRMFVARMFVSCGRQVIANVAFSSCDNDCERGVRNHADHCSLS